MRLFHQIWANIVKNKLFFVSYLFFLVFGLGWLQHQGKEAAFLKMNLWHHPLADAFMPWLTHLGDGLLPAFFVLVLLAFNYRLALTAGVCFTLVLLCVQFSKSLLFEDALRPLAYFAKLGIDIRLIEGVNVHSNNSYPSGHAASAFALGSFVALQLKKKSLGITLLLAAVLVAYTRVYIAQHFFGDILIGSVYGVVPVLVTYSAFELFFMARPTAWQAKGLWRLKKKR